jgi:DNA-binding NarL/FixJ family response regulator
MARQLLLLSSDLILASQLDAPARSAGFAVAVASNVEELSTRLANAQPEVIVLDLAEAAFPLDQTLRLIHEAAPKARILAFYPHVRDELRRAAEVGGCTLVIPRSRFLMRPADALQQALDSGATR